MDKTLLDLPRELLVEILKDLEYREVARCRRVCTLLNSLIDTSSALLYLIELGVEGLIDGRPGGCCTSERLAQLLERRKRWLTLDWSHVHSLAPQEVIPQSPLPYELQGGTFLNVRNRAGQVVINRTLLPTRADPHSEHTNHVLDMHALDITADLTQDLLVMLDVLGRVKVWSLSTYAAHPKAAEPVLRPEGSPVLIVTAALYIAHDLVALVEWSDSVYVTIWNWRTGRTILLGNGSSLPYLATGLAWLSPRAFVLADASRGELAVFSLHGIDCISSPGPRSFHNLPACARLQLPRIDRGWHISHFQLDTTPLLAELPRGAAFAPAPDAHVVVFTLQYVTHNHRRVSSRYMGFVHSRYLMEWLDARPEGEPPRVVPWTEWGPRNTRVMTRTLTGAAFARYVYGQKVVYSRHRPRPWRQLISVYDFNVRPRRIAAIRAGSSSAPSGGMTLVDDESELEDYTGAETSKQAYVEVVDWPTVIRRDSQSALQCHPFVEDVESSLPYVETCRLVDAGGPGVPEEEGLQLQGAQFMMDEDRLIELRMYGEGDAAADSVRVYTL
ncbi:hypothetical protein OH77DRAFT_502769 [Trametes cingulata]|nr:hypothetical protein OH77DRAFT_502769 [Trametes cingulata]